MDYEVIVVGGGIGGLTTAALLAARGVNVCVFERQSQVGGCVANFEQMRYTFEPTAGLYSGWEPEGTYRRIFSQLPVKPPEVRVVSRAYVVRLADHSEIAITADVDQFEAGLQATFPECSEAAADFYRTLWRIADGSLSVSNELTANSLTGTSSRFQSFIDGQLEVFAQCTSEGSDISRAASVLTAVRRGFWAIRGGAQSLADALAQSIKVSGGSVRLNTPVLRFVFDQTEVPIGVDLLSGERVGATRAIVSNLTLWDTYGKLVGPRRTPRHIAVALKRLQGRGAYLMFLAIEDAAASTLTADHVIALPTAGQLDQSPLMFAAAPAWDPRAPSGKRAVTVSTLTDAEEWFTFHQDANEHEARDQAMLEVCWRRLHSAMPELRDSIEVIETATPQTLYEATRRKFGMIGTPDGNPQSLAGTNYTNLFLVGDTVSASASLASVAEGAFVIADHVTK